MARPYITKIDRINAKEATKLNRALKLDSYHPTIPLDKIQEMLNAFDLVMLQEDDAVWSGIICGREGQLTMILGRTNSAREESYGTCYTPIHNVCLQLSWYKMDHTGNYEILAYFG